MDATTGNHDQALAALGDAFPFWHFWVGVGGLWYGRRLKSSPPVVKRAASADGLRREIRAHLAQAGR